MPECNNTRQHLEKNEYQNSTHCDGLAGFLDKISQLSDFRRDSTHEPEN